METLKTNETAEVNNGSGGVIKQVSQKDAVYGAIHANLMAAGIEVKEGESLKSLLTSELRKKVRTTIFEGLKDGVIVYNGKDKSDKKLKEYSAVLVGNWLNRDKRLS